MHKKGASNIKKISTLCIAAFCILCSCTGSAKNFSGNTRSVTAAGSTLDDALEAAAADISNSLNEGTRVAVVQFDTGSEALSAYFVEELIGRLVSSKNLNVVDRTTLDLVFTELDFQMSGYVSDESAQSVGNMLGAQSVVSGTLEDIGNAYRFRVRAVNVQSAVREVSYQETVKKDENTRALVAAFRDQPPAAEKPVIAADAVNDHNEDYFYKIGKEFQLQGAYDKAMEAFNETIRLNPNYAIAYSNRGIIYTARKDYDLAFKDFNQALLLSPRSVPAYTNRGRNYAETGDYDSAIGDYTQALMIEPLNTKVLLNRSSAYIDKGNYDAAVKDCTQALEIDPDYADVYYNRGIAYYYKKDYDAAIRDFNQALTRNPRHIGAYTNRGTAYADKGNYQKALDDYDAALAINPNDADALYNREITQKQMQRQIQKLRETR